MQVTTEIISSYAMVFPLPLRERVRVRGTFPKFLFENLKYVSKMLP
jgi:hypothetical protein